MALLGFADPAPTPKPEPSGRSGGSRSASRDSSAGPANPAAQQGGVESQGNPDDLGAAAEPAQSIGQDFSLTLMMLMPWIISLLLHAGVVLLALFISFTVSEAMARRDKDNELDNRPVIPLAQFSKNAGGAMNLTKHTTQNIVSQASGGAPRNLTKAPEHAPFKPGVGAGGGRKGFQGLIGLGNGGDGSDKPTGGGAKFNPWGGTGSGDGFQTNFVGVSSGGGNARHIVFVIDASGSLIEGMPFVINELRKTIGELSDEQTFAVVFFQDDQVIEAPPTGMKPATSANKQKVLDWLDPARGNVTPSGMTSPVKAVTTALRYNPDLIFILSDNITGQGRYEVPQDQLLSDIRKALNQRTKINTIQFLQPDPLAKIDKQGKGTLAKITDLNGGIYKFVDAHDLGIE